jgi:hypothetical protein
MEESIGEANGVIIGEILIAYVYSLWWVVLGGG